jgi:cytochrome c oxidase subunit 3
MWVAHSGIKAGQGSKLKFGLALTTLLGVLFLAGQTLVWLRLAALGLPPRSNLYAFSFYWLTGLHAAHVIGGIAFMLVVTRAAFLGRYSKHHHTGVTYAAMYWHFLDAVWIALFLIIFVF